MSRRLVNARDRGAEERAGRRAERIAAWWLMAKGFQVVARRYRTPLGEIDLVCRRRRLVIFVEVKRRTSLEIAATSISARQRRRIARAAEHFMARRIDHVDGCAIRFDVVLVTPWRRPRHVIDAWRPEASA